MAPPPATSGSRAVMSEVDGRTIELRIRISRPAEGSTRCNVSRAQAQPRNSSQLTPPSTISSTSSATSHQPEHTEPCAQRRSIHGAMPWRLLEIARTANLFPSFFDNVTMPSEEKVVGFYNAGDRVKFWGQNGAMWGGLWSLFFSGIFMTIPIVGPVMVLGH